MVDEGDRWRLALMLMRLVRQVRLVGRGGERVDERIRIESLVLSLMLF